MLLSSPVHSLFLRMQSFFFYFGHLKVLAISVKGYFFTVMITFTCIVRSLVLKKLRIAKYKCSALNDQTPFSGSFVDATTVFVTRPFV